MFITMFLFLIKAEANVIHTVYFQAADQPEPSKDNIREIKGIMLKTQAFYSREMKRYDHEPKTFNLERDDAGQIVIHIVNGKHDLKVYSDLPLIDEELPPEIHDFFWLKNKIRVVFLAGANDIGGVGGIARKVCQGNLCGHTAYVPDNDKIGRLHTTLHEVGHTFGLDHNAKKPPEEKHFVMAAVVIFDLNKRFNLNNYVLDADEAEMLNNHPFFINNPLSVTASILVIKTWGALKVQHR